MKTNTITVQLIDKRLDLTLKEMEKNISFSRYNTLSERAWRLMEMKSWYN